MLSGSYINLPRSIWPPPNCIQGDHRQFQFFFNLVSLVWLIYSRIIIMIIKGRKVLPLHWTFNHLHQILRHYTGNSKYPPWCLNLHHHPPPLVKSSLPHSSQNNCYLLRSQTSFCYHLPHLHLHFPLPKHIFWKKNVFTLFILRIILSISYSLSRRASLASFFFFSR